MKRYIYILLTVVLGLFIVQCEAPYKHTDFVDNSIYTVVVESEDSLQGSVDGTGNYKAGTEIELVAVPEKHYQFLVWHDNDSTNPRSLTVTCDTMFTARFERAKYELVTLVNDSALGMVIGGGVYEALDKAVITARAHSGCCFLEWSDGVQDSVRTILMEKDTTLTAHFLVIKHTVTLAVNYVQMGVVQGSGIYNENEFITITATPNEGYRFVNWSDGNIENIRKIQVTEDIALTANFEALSYTIAVNVNDATMGSVTGGGVYKTAEVATLTAIPNETYRFVNWSDGNVDNPREINVKNDVTLTANFAAYIHTIAVDVNDEAMGTVTGGGTYKSNEIVTLTAIPNAGYEFVKWSDGFIDNPRKLTVTQDLSITAQFTATKHNVSALVNNSSWGSTSGGGNYKTDEVATLTATPAIGYRFVNWSDGNTDNPRQVTVKGDMTFIANFEPLVHLISVQSDNETMGSVTGTGNYKTRETITITALPNENYKFVRWSDGDVTNPRYIVVSQSLSLIATFEHITHMVNVMPKDPSMGTVRGSGTYHQGTTITIEAIPEPNHKFRNWSDGNTDNPRNIVVTESITLTANFDVYIERNDSGIYNGHKYIDLGLPSGTLWATQNVGAQAEDDSFLSYCGDVFYWGTTTNSLGSGEYKYGTNDYVTKYCTDAAHGIVDNKTILDASDDAATVNWGGAWRMPTKQELQELIDYCTWTPIDNGDLWRVEGTNGNSIILSANLTGIVEQNGYASVVELMEDAALYWCTALGDKSTTAVCLGVFNDGFNKVGLVTIMRTIPAYIRPVVSSQ